MTAVDIPAIRALIAEARTLHADWKAEMKKRRDGGRGMSDIFNVLARMGAAKEAIKQIVPDHGGILRCEACGRIGEPKGEYMNTGWPKCHGQTMRWWTSRQIADGEMSEFGVGRG